MEKVASDLLVGTTAGLVATFLAFFFGRFWKAVVEPWYEERIYKDVKVAGRWRGNILAGGIVREVLWEIHQTGHKIRATVIPISGPNKGKQHKIEGRFRNLLLTVTYAVEDKNALDGGCLSLKLIQNGRRLQGYAIIYNPATELLETVDYTIDRELASALPSVTIPPAVAPPPPAAHNGAALAPVPATTPPTTGHAGGT